MLPASGQAQVFGSGLLHQPNQTSCPLTACTIAATVELPAEGGFTSAGSPIDGVITSFRVRAKVDTPTQATLRAAFVNGFGSGETTATSDDNSPHDPAPTVTLQVAGADAPPQQFAVRFPVRRGEHLALEGTGLVVTHDSNGEQLSFAFTPPLVAGQEAKSSQALGELLVQATVEPDADGDRFGDETQDKCPVQKTEGAPCDFDQPRVRGLRVGNGKVSYRLSEPALVRFVLTKKNGRHFKRFGRPPFFRAGKQGLNKVSLPENPKLKAGAYRLQMTASDEAGHTATEVVRFAIPER